MFPRYALAALGGASAVLAKCFDPSPAFPVPLWKKPGPVLPSSAFIAIENALREEIGEDILDSSSFTAEVTSNTETLWTYYHTAKFHDKDRPGVVEVDGTSQYRIASITKTFTTLGILYQHAAGNLSLDDSVVKYVPELAETREGGLPFKDITLRILASQLSGIPREFAQSDLLYELEDPTVIGLPPATDKRLPDCVCDPKLAPCNGSDLIESLKMQRPVFAPNQQSTYSNDNFNILGLVLERVTGLNYSEYIKTAVFEPLNLTFASLDKPSDKHAVLPPKPWYWDVEEGVQRPTGGIYASGSDLSKFLRYVLTHFNALATGVNWFMPASWSGGLKNFYGMPWEIYRSDSMLPHSKRPVTSVTKSGSLPSYYSIINALPEYGLGVTVLVAGNSTLKGKVESIVVSNLVRAAEAAVWESIDETHTGDYVAVDASLNSSLSFISSASTGLMLSHFISNGTDVFTTLLPQFADPDFGGAWRAQLVPTLLYKNETAQAGEIWRILLVPERYEGSEKDEYCLTDVDPATYAGLPLNEVVFWLEDGLVELPAWKLTVKAADAGDSEEKLVLQHSGDL